MAYYAALLLQTDTGDPILPAPHHWLWLTLMTDERIKRLLIIAPPESAKTTWAISAFLGTYIGFNPERSVIIGSVTGTVAEKRSMSLRAMVENPEWKKTFPGVRPIKASGGFKWEVGEWSLAPDGIPFSGRLHPTLAAYGTGGSIIGSRADLVIGDDLLDFQNTRTAFQRKTVETWIHNSFLSRRKSKTGRAIMIGTVWHSEDFYSKARREGGWIVCHVPLLSEGKDVFATITYPDSWRHETLGTPVGSAQL